MRISSWRAFLDEHVPDGGVGAPQLLADAVHRPASPVQPNRLGSLPLTEGLPPQWYGQVMQALRHSYVMYTELLRQLVHGRAGLVSLHQGDPFGRGEATLGLACTRTGRRSWLGLGQDELGLLQKPTQSIAERYIRPTGGVRSM